MHNKLDEAMEVIANVKKILAEDYELGQEMPDEMGPEDGYDGEQVLNDEQNLAQKDERISQIREIALEGLQDYSHDVDSEEYQFYKKIWLMCDKAVSDKEAVGES